MTKGARIARPRYVRCAGPYCAGCEFVLIEEWPKEKLALRCGAEGERFGSTTHIFPKGHPNLAWTTAPVWCSRR